MSSLSPLCHCMVLVTCHDYQNTIQTSISCSPAHPATCQHIECKNIHCPSSSLRIASQNAFQQDSNGDCWAELPLQITNSNGGRHLPCCYVPIWNQVPMIINGLLDHHITDWISANRNCIIALLFVTFMIEFWTNYLAEDWEEDMLHKLLSMTLGNSTFWDCTVAIQAKNSLLQGTISHLPDDKPWYQLAAGMEIWLSQKISIEKLNKVPEFCKWLNKVQRCNEGLCANREEYECIKKDMRDSSHHTNNYTEPSSCCVPNNDNLAPTVPFAPCKQCPKLLETECKLLNDHDGWLCCQLSQRHTSGSHHLGNVM